MADSGGGSGPGDHPGAVVVPLTADAAATAQALMVALNTGVQFEFKYVPGEFAVLTDKYPKPQQ